MLQTRLKTVCRLIATALYLAGAPAVLAGDPTARNGDRDKYGVFTFVTENDLYALDNSDRHYTNGVRLGWLSPAGEMPEFLHALGRALPLVDQDATKRYGLALGHNLYTPEDKTRRDLISRDRPYAAWLYTGIAMQWETTERLDTIELDLGVVGPAAFGEQVQNHWHRLIGANAANGWNNQLRNEPGVALVFERKWRWLIEAPESGLGVDAIPHVNGSLGNVFTYGGAGVTFRVGENLKSDFGPPRIRPALPGSASFDPPDLFGWYFFIGAEGRAIARDIFLDGNTFTDSHSVSKKPVVADFQAGLALLLLRHARLSYTQVFRTREFDEQTRPDMFGSLSLSLRF